MFSQLRSDKLFNLLVNICNSHNAIITSITTETSLGTIYFIIYVDAEIDDIVDMNFELAEKITSDDDLNCIKHIFVFKK